MRIRTRARQSHLKYFLASNGEGSSKYVLFPAHFRLMVLLGFANVVQAVLQLSVGLLGPATTSDEHDNITAPILYVRHSSTTWDRPTDRPTNRPLIGRGVPTACPTCHA